MVLTATPHSFSNKKKFDSPLPGHSQEKKKFDSPLPVRGQFRQAILALFPVPCAVQASHPCPLPCSLCSSGNRQALFVFFPISQATGKMFKTFFSIHSPGKPTQNFFFQFTQSPVKSIQFNSSQLTFKLTQNIYGR